MASTTITIQMIINDQLVTKDINEFFEHFKLMAAKPCKYSLVFNDNPMITEEKRLAIQYKIEMYGEQKVIIYMVFFTFSDDKICLWNQLVSTVSATEMQLTHQ